MRRKLLVALIFFSVLAPMVQAFTFNSPTFAWQTAVGKGVFYFDSLCTFDTWLLEGGLHKFTNFKMGATAFGSLGLSVETALAEATVTLAEEKHLRFEMVAGGAATTKVYVPILLSPITITGATYTWDAVNNIATITTAGTVIVNIYWQTVDTYDINIYTTIPEVEVGMMSLLYATCVDNSSVCHNETITFTIDGADFKWVPERTRYEAVVRESTPQIKLYNSVDSITDENNPTVSGFVTTPALVTWINSRIEAPLDLISGGDLPGALWEMGVYQIGGTFLYTFTSLAVSVALYQFSGPEIVMVAWLLMWGAWSSVVHGVGQQLGVVFLVMGIGVLIAKLYMDRRGSYG